MKTIARHYRSIFISDCHFGYSISRADLLANFLKYHTCENLFLVGDIVDFWVLEKKWHWPIDDAYAVVEIFKKIQAGSGADDREMYQVFNMGCRMEIYTDEDFASTVIQEAGRFNIEARLIGRVEASNIKELIIKNENGELIFRE